MKSIELQTFAFKKLETGFKEWLQTLGYSPNTVYYLPIHLREFFHYLEQNKVKTISNIEEQHIRNYFNYLSCRHHQRRTGSLSTSYVNKHIQAMKNFWRYLRETGKNLVTLPIPSTSQPQRKIKVLTKEQIQQLYRHIDEKKPFGERDRAMLDIFYGCGLRRNEGFELDIKDLMFRKGLVYVRKGKNYKERYVPMNKQVMSDLQSYIKNGRKRLARGTKDNALFLNQRGKRITGQALNLRFKLLMEKAGIWHEDMGLHILRHSIATHLMQSGMKIEDISQMLGHNSLESTQIYTHLAHEF